MVLDANVVIALLNERDGLHVDAFDLVDDNAWDEFCTSAVTLSETLVRATALGAVERERSKIGLLGVRIVPVTSAMAHAAARLRSEHRLHLADAIVVSTTTTMRGRLATFDKRVRRIAHEEGIEVAAVDDDGLRSPST